MARHNLKTVIHFEFFRTVSKKRFWISTLIVPVILAVVFGLLFLSNKSTADTSDAQKEARFSFEYIDESELVSDDVISAVGGVEVNDKNKAISDVKSGAVDAFFYFPTNPSKETVEVYGKNTGIFENGKYGAVAEQILTSSAEQGLDNPELVSIAKGQVNVETVTYENGEVSGGIGSVVAPLIFLVIFYMVIVMLGNQMLNSTLEEKENRVTEMILTTLNPTTLIVGKIISLYLVGLVQILVFMTPIILGYLFFRTELNIPSFDLSTLVFDPVTLTIGALLLIGGFTLFTGALVAVGAVMPTAKEAGNIFGVMMAMIFIPFYVIALIVSDPHALIVEIFTFFPFSAPVTAMLRNAFGSLSLLDAGIVIAILFISGIIILRLAVRLFRYGSMEYTKRTSLKTIIGSKKNS